ncbi:hypothetical protein KA005_84625 [bacterium]|nr:hypothetical protein [bacterium]
MGLTFNGIGGEGATTSFLKEKLVPIIEKRPNISFIAMSNLVDAFGLNKIGLGGVPALVSKLKKRGNIIVIKGKQFKNKGSAIDVELEVKGWKDERFELATNVTGRLQLFPGRVFGLMDLEGLEIGNSDVKWIKFLPMRGVYIRRSWTGNDYFIDWHFEPKDETFKLGIDDKVEKLVGR